MMNVDDVESLSVIILEAGAKPKWGRKTSLGI